MPAKTHGLTKHTLFHVWDKMKQRCYNRNDPRYDLYGGRGVTVCKEWKNDFKKFYDWALANGWVDGLELDKDKLSPYQTGILYSPKYCCFIPHKENCQHTSRSRLIEYNGITQVLSKWCEQMNLDYKTTHRRLYEFGWDVSVALNPPLNYTRGK